MPQLRLDIDRAKAEQLGVSLQSLFDALGTYVGSSFLPPLPPPPPRGRSLSRGRMALPTSSPARTSSTDKKKGARRHPLRSFADPAVQ